jgi:hypothetical protein
VDAAGAGDPALAGGGWGHPEAATHGVQAPDILQRGGDDRIGGARGRGRIDGRLLGGAPGG